MVPCYFHGERVNLCKEPTKATSMVIYVCRTATVVTPYDYSNKQNLALTHSRRGTLHYTTVVRGEVRGVDVWK